MYFANFALSSEAHGEVVSGHEPYCSTDFLDSPIFRPFADIVRLNY